MTEQIISRDLVLVGGGHSHVHVLRSLAERPIAGLRTTIISREVLTPYSGMLPGYIAGHYDWLDIHLDLATLCSVPGTRLITGTVSALDLDNRLLSCNDRPPVRFDLLSINVGTVPATGHVHGADRFGMAAKPINRFVLQWHVLREKLLAEPDRRFRIAVVGGGANSVELALAMDHRLRVTEGLNNIEMILIAAAPELITGHKPQTRRMLMKELGKRHFDVHLGARVIAVEDGALETDVDGRLEIDEVLWATKAVPQSWPGDAGLVVDEDGFIMVNDKLQSLSDAKVFAAGDIATIVGDPRPKTGVFAVQQGRVLAENLRRAVAGEALKSFRSQDLFLSFISTGDRRAVVSRGDFAMTGRWVWRWKDWVDRRFMARFAVRADSDSRPEGTIMAAGVAAGASREGLARGDELLDRVFARLNLSLPAKAVVGTAEDAALLRPVVNSLEVQTIGSLGELVSDPYLLGRIAVAHTMNNIFSMGGVPRTAMVSVTIPLATRACMEDDLFLLLSGVVSALEPIGASVIAGHARVADRLNINIAVTGTVDESDALYRRRAAIDNLLILTKPVGTGILLAAAREARCRSDWLFGAINSMQVAHLEALTTLRTAGVRSCTAIAESGVLGHVRDMVGGAKLSAELWPEHVPWLDGALELLATGSIEFLRDSNERVLEGLDCGEFGSADPRVRGLSDAQTSGGLLVAIRAEKAVQCVSALREIGYLRTAIVGRVLPPGVDGTWCTLTSPDTD